MTYEEVLAARLAAAGHPYAYAPLTVQRPKTPRKRPKRRYDKRKPGPLAALPRLRSPITGAVTQAKTPEALNNLDRLTFLRSIGRFAMRHNYWPPAKRLLSKDHHPWTYAITLAQGLERDGLIVLAPDHLRLTNRGWGAIYREPFIPTLPANAHARRALRDAVEHYKAFLALAPEERTVLESLLERRSLWSNSSQYSPPSPSRRSASPPSSS